MTHRSIRGFLIIGVVLLWMMTALHYLPWWIAILIGFPVGWLTGYSIAIIDRWIGDE